MENNLKFIELKSGYSDDGPAWIGNVEFSKSGRTIYFNGKAFKSLKGYQYAYSSYSNYFDIETMEKYWISGIKKNGHDRHWAGKGKIMIDMNAVDEYLRIVGSNELDKSKFDIVEIPATDKKKFQMIENGNTVNTTS